MSINLIVIASVTLINDANGKKVKYKDSFPVYQTPSNITFQIVDSDDPAQAYRDWVYNLYEKPEDDPEYDSEHIDRFNKWLDDMNDLGASITFCYD